jgi:hypothetical protein
MPSLLDASVEFRDNEIAASVRYEDQIRVLRSLGWVSRGCVGRFVEIWQKETLDAGIFEVHAIHGEPSDKSLLIRTMIRVISAAEDIPPLRVVLLLLPDLPVV